jgi:hypothetical protein
MKIKWRLRQIIPTKFATGVRELGTEQSPKSEAVFIQWWMWLGRSFKVQRTVI